MSPRESKTAAREGVLLCGAYGMDNAGDDAVLRAICARLRELRPGLPITVLARQPARTAARFGVDAVHPLRVLRWLSLMGRTRLFLSGGGSLLQDVTSRRSLLYYLLTIRAAKARGCAVQLYGCGIGPLRSDRSRRQAVRTLDRCADVITLRDRDSARLLAALGVTAPVRLAADPALSLPPFGGPREPRAGFALRPWPGLEERREDIAACAHRLWEDRGLTPELICLAPEDRAPAAELAALLQRRGVPCAITEDPARIGRMSLVISLRLHGLIFALREGVPAAGLSYDPKVAAFCAEAGLPCLELAETGAETLRRAAEAALALEPSALALRLAGLRDRERINGAEAGRLLGAASGAGNDIVSSELDEKP